MAPHHAKITALRLRVQGPLRVPTGGGEPSSFGSGPEAKTIRRILKKSFCGVVLPNLQVPHKLGLHQVTAPQQTVSSPTRPNDRIRLHCPWPGE